MAEGIPAPVHPIIATSNDTVRNRKEMRDGLGFKMPLFVHKTLFPGAFYHCVLQKPEKFTDAICSTSFT